jgi:hypothetical protein
MIFSLREGVTNNNSYLSQMHCEKQLYVPVRGTTKVNSGGPIAVRCGQLMLFLVNPHQALAVPATSATTGIREQTLLYEVT